MVGTKAAMRVNFFEDKSFRWNWRLRASNGWVICTGTSCARMSDCFAAARKFSSFAYNPAIVSAVEAAIRAAQPKAK